ncbi:thioredoxin-like protein [Coemansia spiralis]|nr:thioredoxin-like protein [Coemansia spiralis]
MAGDSVLSITALNKFNETVEEKDLVVIDFTATWCGPCKLISPVFVKLSEEYKDKATFIKVDVDDGAEIAGQVGVRAMPTFKFFHKGKEVEDLEIVGADKNSLKKNVESLISRYSESAAAAVAEEKPAEEKPAEEKPAEEEKPAASS